MEMLNKAKERFGFRNVWTLDGRIYYLAEGSTKPQIFRNWTEVACFELWKKICGVNSFFVLLLSLFIFLGENYLRKQFFTSKFIILLLYNGIAPLIFCFDLISTKNWSTYYFFLLSQFHHTFIAFCAFNFECNLIVLLPKRIISYNFLLKQHLQQCCNGK